MWIGVVVFFMLWVIFDGIEKKFGIDGSLYLFNIVYICMVFMWYFLLGILKEVLLIFFEKFILVYFLIIRKYGGIGLGLVICK